MDGGYLDDEEFDEAMSRDGRFRTLYIRLAADGDNDAATVLAEMLRTEAVKGSSVAQVGWGHMLMSGVGTARDRDASFRWFRIAARQGNADALNMVGRCYELGRGVAADLAEAAQWYERAARSGHAWAQFNLATLFAQGRGVPATESRAVSLLVQAARQGNPKAMNMLGRYREDQPGTSRVKAIRSAAFWYRRAAAGGCFRGQFHHGRLLADAQRCSEALHWFSTSLGRAPDDFRRDALDMISRHPDASVRALAHDEAYRA